ncbi:MAG: DNA polymerase II large subunit [Candidatus Thermoplasmatota archaeon]|nr:DNA polymerase II large subunit [Candidatus Thermoplasmatota archaeon]
MSVALIVSNEMEAYFEDLEKKADTCYTLVEKVRKAGFDPSTSPEIPRAKDLAERVEAQVGPVGIAPRIREVAEENDRESTALIIAKELARRLKSELGLGKALEQAVRTSLSILTEGVLVAPTEGVVKVSTLENSNKTKCASIYYAGPIRAAGGTAQALSVLIADVVRRELDLDPYIPTPAEIERYKEEIPLYKRAVNLQYVPSPEEIHTIVTSCPICITGERTDKLEVAGNRDLPRVETNSLRGGACLVLAEGLCLKAAKVLKHVDKLGISGWDFLRTYTEKKRKSASGDVKEHKYLKDVLAGRPIFAFPDRPGSFRLRYGRSRTAGLASMSVHPSTMLIVDSFAAIGTQLKLQLPGKATASTPCDTIEGPSVILQDGTFTRLDDYNSALEVVNRVTEIIDLGELLIPVGEFLENNHPLQPSGWCNEWWDSLVDSKGIKYDGDYSFRSLYIFCKENDLPLHPKYTFNWGDLECNEILDLRGQLVRNGPDVVKNRFSKIYKEVFIKLGMFFRIEDNTIVLDEGYEPLITLLGIKETDGKLLASELDSHSNDSLTLLSNLSEVLIKCKSPTRIGASMGRPEKANERRLKPPPHVLFPLGDSGGNQRLINTALKERPNRRGFTKGKLGTIEMVTQLRYCKNCNKETISLRCCKSLTMVKEDAKKRLVDVSEIVTKAMNNTKVGILPKVKGIKELTSGPKIPESFEKGILRSKYDLRVYKDGTLRYDMIDLPITHFYPKEIGLSVEKALELGYSKDIDGNKLESENQLLELKVQDLIVSKNAGPWLVKVANFVNEELVKLYGSEPFYEVTSNSVMHDLIGSLLICLSPHTSAGVLGRLIGFTSAKAQYGHPFFHAAKRRNCDGDEDSIMLLLDGLLNFSDSFVPTTRGGTMDIPRVLSTRIDPMEIDSEAHNVELNSKYPLEFYEHSEKFSNPVEVLEYLDTVSKRLESPEQYEGYSFTHSSSNINLGPNESRYVTLDSMKSKAIASLELAKKTRASDASYVAEQTIEKHFIRDIIGNLRSFSTQGVRCKKCNTKYRRPPLKNTCSCGGLLQLNISPASVAKYRQIAGEIADKYGSRKFIRQRLELAFSAIEETLENEQIKQMDLGAFL